MIKDVFTSLDPADREQIARLRERGHYFWIDLGLGDAGADPVAEQCSSSLGISPEVLGALLGFRADQRPSRAFHIDGHHVVFSFNCFLDPEDGVAEAMMLPVHVLVHGDYLLTVHEGDIPLPRVLGSQIPDGRSDQYRVYSVLDAMLGTAFDALSEVEAGLAEAEALPVASGGARQRMAKLREISNALSDLRRHVGPQRGVFERVSEEISAVEGLEPDQERYFERIYTQLNQLVLAIDSSSDALTKLIDLRLNETIYRLTVVATIFLPLTFITGFFGMNFGWMVDHITSPLAFVALGLIAPTILAVGAWILVQRRDSDT